MSRAACGIWPVRAHWKPARQPSAPLKRWKFTFKAIAALPEGMNITGLSVTSPPNST